MPPSRPRHGSLQFYPRSRAERVLPRVKWKFIQKKDVGLMGFIGYKAGMKSAFVKDNSTNSMTKGQRIILPVTVIECPTMKILSLRFYNSGKLIGEVLNKNVEKEMRKKIKLPKNVTKKIEDYSGNDFDDVRVIVYSLAKKTGIRKVPAIHEIGISGGSASEKLEFAKTIFNKEISVKEVFKDGLVDIRAVTKGKGLQGPTKRFGLTLRSHKAEKGQRFHGSGGPWHPARVEYTHPMAGQMGFFSRVVYNSKILLIANQTEKDVNGSDGFPHFGKILTDYMVIMGSVQGPQKREILLTSPLRPNKNHTRKSYEFIELR